MLSFLPLCLSARTSDIAYGVSLTTNAGRGDFAPYYVTSNVHGTLTQRYSSLLRLNLSSDTVSFQRVRMCFGADLIGGYSSATDYGYFDAAAEAATSRTARPSSLWIQQAFADVRYHSVKMVVGLKEQGSAMLNDRLSSGDLTMSANSRPMPGILGGLSDFSDIPFTRGWVQIDGALSYYRQSDSRWLRNHYNYYNSFITTNVWFNYKRIYFRTKPSQPFSLTIGMQAACQFGGAQSTYYGGKFYKTVNMRPNLKSFFHALIPGSGGDNPGDQAYKEGNHVGSWDVAGRLRLPDGTIFKAYYQSPWEDGSGVGKLNGFDGLYGIEYVAPHQQSLLSGAVVEYIDFTNQSGPIHWAPHDFPGTTITKQATGADNYYNNYSYNGYQYYGMAIGSPMAKSPIFNTDGYIFFTDNRFRGFHLGLEGYILPQWQYRILGSYRKSWGTIFIPALEKRHSLSALFETSYAVKRTPGLAFTFQIASDRGNLYGNNFGVLFSIRYSGLLKL